MTTIEQLGGLTAQHNEIIKRVVNGSLSPISVKHALQNIIEGAVKAPSIVEQVVRQLATWKNLGVAISDELWEQILQRADAFEPFTDTDEPLVTGGFGYNNPKLVVDKLINAFTPVQGYTKMNSLRSHELRYAPDFRPKGELRLVHYDANAYPTLSPRDARKAAKKDGLQLAGIEVFEHLMLEPQTGFTWDGTFYYYPNASGLDRKVDGKWSRVPCVDRWDEPDRKFGFISGWVGRASDGWSSPVVREVLNLGS